MIYQWAVGTPSNQRRLNVQVVAATLESLRVAHGGLNPKLVVEAARGEESPLHGGFEWDDTKAAQAHRLDQARGMMARIIVKIDDAGEPSPPVRAFVCMNRGKADSYVHVSVVMNSPEMRRDAIQAALKELHAWQRRHKDLVELAAVFEAIEATKEEAA